MHFVYSKISMLLINSTGRVAVTSGDFKFLFTTWQGVLLILITLLTLFLFVGLNINSLIILSKRLLTGEKPSVLLCIKEGFLSIKRILNPVGLLVVLFISLFAPIIGFGGCNSCAVCCRLAFRFYSSRSRVGRYSA